MTEILLITTGGTIASAASEEGLTPKLTGDDLLSPLSLPNHIHVTVLPLFSLDSTNITPAHWEEMAACIRSHYDDYDGFVITHGTDTLSYTAAALSAMIEGGKKTIVLTGSQLPMDAPDSDGPRNLRDAICTAAEALEGVYVVFHKKVMDGACVKKNHTRDADAFLSVDKPIIAHWEGGEIIRSAPRPARDATPRFHLQMSACVAILPLVPGLDPNQLLRLSDSADGILLQSYGAGGIPSLDDSWCEALKIVQREMTPVVLISQVPLGGTHLSTYQVGNAALACGVLEGDHLTPEAAFAALTLALTEGADYGDVQRKFLDIQRRLQS